ncbi:MAG: phosphatase PAP2 family protein [Flavobacteriales bacterium]|nr:phosphatase PAP2 family protein [Flavobacteriales bacterium]
MRAKKSIHPFLFTWAAFTVVLLLAVLGTDQLDLHRIMHAYTSLGADRFFATITHLADGLVPTALSVILLFMVSMRAFLMMGLSCGLSAIAVQILKRVFAYDRPYMFKDRLGDLPWVEGMELHHHLSFPSGHATAAFSMCFALAILVDRGTWSLVLGVLAAVLAYSRVYLSQHFTEDILAGAALGTLIAHGVYLWLDHTSMKDKAWLRWRPFN